MVDWGVVCGNKGLRVQMVDEAGIVTGGLIIMRRGIVTVAEECI